MASVDTRVDPLQIIGPVYHPYMLPSQYSDVSRSTPNPSVLAAAYELYDDAKITALKVAVEHADAAKAPTTPIGYAETVPILTIFNNADPERPRPLTLYEAHTSWTLVAATTLMTMGGTQKLIHRPRLVGNLPGGSYELEHFWALVCFLISLCKESLVLSLATGDHWKTFQRVERVLAGAFSSPESFPSLWAFFIYVNDMSIFNHLSGRIFALSPCKFASMEEIVADPGAFYLFNILVKYTSEASDAIIQFLAAESIKAVSRFSVCGQQIPPADELSMWLASEINSIVNSERIAGLFVSSISFRSLNALLSEGNSKVLQARLALYTSAATIKMVKAFINKATESTLLHALYRTHQSGEIPLQIFALAAALVQARVGAIRNGCQSGSMYPVEAVGPVDELEKYQFWWAIHLETITALQALKNAMDQEAKSNSSPSRLMPFGLNLSSPSQAPRSGLGSPAARSPSSSLQIPATLRSQFQVFREELDGINKSLSLFSFDLIMRAELIKQARNDELERSKPQTPKTAKTLS